MTGAAQAGTFAGLFDDAALFPPGNAPMDDAVAAHATHRSSPYADLLGPFICAEDRIGELSRALPGDGTTLDVSVVVRGGLVAVPSALMAVMNDARLRLAAIEVAAEPHPGPGGVDALNLVLPSGLRSFVEVPLGRLESLDALAGTPYAAKVRTGGTEASAFPSESVLAAAITRCVASGLPFKCTAGLHNAVRHTDAATGFEHHGFLNVMSAVHAALTGGTAEEVAVALASRETIAVAETVAAFSGDDVAAVRRIFLSFGTCSIREPLDDLLALGLVRFS